MQRLLEDKKKDNADKQEKEAAVSQSDNDPKNVEPEQCQTEEVDEKPKENLPTRPRRSKRKKRK